MPVPRLTAAAGAPLKAEDDDGKENQGEGGGGG
jgi:hypothetical protein